MARKLLESPERGAAAPIPTSDAVAAMLALGYKRSKSEHAIVRAFKELGRDTPIEEIVRKALQLV
jgi:Holliday junction resolvasome RuvABC DNA-binding subunit